MKPLFELLAAAAMLLALGTTSVAAADCACERVSGEGCLGGVEVFEEPAAPPQWCERTDDPRCMPANTSNSAVTTLVPVAMSWAEPLRWDAPARSGFLLDIWIEGDPRTEHSRRVERPPR